MSTDLCIVSPSSAPEWALLGDRVFLQAGWKHPDLELLNDKYVILDMQHPVSGAANVQRGPISMDELEAYYSVIRRVQPDEVVVPDVLLDSKATLVSTKKFFEHLPTDIAERELAYMFVPQGNTADEWLQSRDDMTEAPFYNRISTVGIAMHMERFISRFALLDEVPKHCKIHFLGCWRGVGELTYDHLIRSWDTSLPIAAAQEDKYLSNMPRDYKPHLVEGKHVDSLTAIANLAYCKRLLSGPL